MTVETELVELLTADETVLTTVGDRIFPVALRKQTALPAITYSRNSGSREYALDANVVSQSATLVLRCWADAYPAARELADACAVALDRNTTSVIDVITVIDGADVWLEDRDAFGCTLVVEMEQYL